MIDKIYKTKYIKRKSKRRSKLTKVERANLEEELLPDSIFEKYLNYEVNGLNLTLEALHAGNVSNLDVDWTLDVIEKHLRETYEKVCGTHFERERKRKEITHKDARFLFIRDDKTKEKIAFSVFRIDEDYGCQVLYCYELHVEEKYQGHGIGKHLLNVLELVARNFQMEKVILTVFKCNEAAIRFYTRHKFKIDFTSPKDEERKSYVILSKATNAV